MFCPRYHQHAVGMSNCTRLLEHTTDADGRFERTTRWTSYIKGESYQACEEFADAMATVEVKLGSPRLR